MENNHFQYAFTTSKAPGEVFSYLLNPNNWWIGLYGETIEGKSAAINDEFSFKAGDGVHYSNQQLIDLTIHEKILWLVKESNLSFLENTNEWAGTKICFDIEQEAGKTKVIFSHIGLVPAIECYERCTGAWTKYLQKLDAYFNQ